MASLLVGRDQIRIFTQHKHELHPPSLLLPVLITTTPPALITTTPPALITTTPPALITTTPLALITTTPLALITTTPLVSRDRQKPLWRGPFNESSATHTRVNLHFFGKVRSES